MTIEKTNTNKIKEPSFFSHILDKQIDEIIRDVEKIISGKKEFEKVNLAVRLHVIAITSNDEIKLKRLFMCIINQIRGIRTSSGELASKLLDTVDKSLVQVRRKIVNSRTQTDQTIPQNEPTNK